MIVFTIEVAVRYALKRTKRSSLLFLVGKVQATRKNPHVIDVGLELDIQHNYWYYMLTEISTMPMFVT
jgi:hypothetical protein